MENIKVLVITSLLPIKELSHKRHENDIILVTNSNICEHFKNISFSYLYKVTYSNKILGLFSQRWKEFSSLCQKKEIKIKGIRIAILPLIQLPFRSLWRSAFFNFSLFLYKRRLSEIIKNFEPTVVHAQDVDSAAFIARYILKKYNIPYVITLRGINFCQDSIVRSNICKSDQIIAVSETQRDYLDKMGISRECEMIPHGIEDIFYSNIVRTYSGKELRLLFIGRLLPSKNLDIVIKSVEKNNAVTLDVIGDGVELDSLKKLVERLGLKFRVRFLGRKSHGEISCFLKNYDLFVMPSSPETLGRVYFEVMASGMPIVACHETGVDGIVKHGKEGFLVRSRSIVDLEAVYREILKTPHLLEVMGSNCRVLANKYNWVEISRKYYEVYSKFFIIDK